MRRVLSMDGGGIRGLITVRLLQRIEDETGARFSTSADPTKNHRPVALYAGTSTGGLLALALARGHGTEYLRREYLALGPHLFKFSRLKKPLGGITSAKHHLGRLEERLKHVLGESTTLGDLHAPVLIGAFDLERDGRWEAKLFHSQPGPGSDEEVEAWRVGLATAAAPTFFPSTEGYIDGGVVANNPAMCAVAQLLDPRYNPTDATTADVVCLSVGTGRSKQAIGGTAHNWGIVQWGPKITGLMLDSSGAMEAYQVSRILRDRHFRLQFDLPEAWAMDESDPDTLRRMVGFADTVDIEPACEWVYKYWFPERE